LARDLRTLRKSWKLSQRRLAELSGTTQRTIALIEAGAANPTLEILERVFAPMGKEPRILMQNIPNFRRKKS
jgi:predicted transcriptional regulator